MTALSTGTYGKAPIMSVQAHLTDLADRLTAILEAAHDAIGGLSSGIATGAPVDQGHVNTLVKVTQDLGELATTARQAAADEAGARAREAAQPGSGTAPQQGSGTAQGGSRPAGSGSTKA